MRRRVGFWMCVGLALACGAATAQGDAMTRETATFAAGCFWGVEPAFRQVKGVLEKHGGTCPLPSF